jgi:GntR family transcriptional regulator
MVVERADEGGTSDALIRFRLDPRSGLPAYRQLADQVRHAVSLGRLRPGDRLPSVREVVSQITINPNTVHRAYRELEIAGVAEARQGLGTFIATQHNGQIPAAASEQEELLRLLAAWVARARQAGLDDEALRALVNEALDRATSSHFENVRKGK